MIEISARLIQGAYLSGETVECSITFTCLKKNDGNNSKDEPEILGLSSAQIYCKCQVSQSHSILLSNTNEQVIGNKSTSFAPLLNDENILNNIGNIPASETTTSSTNRVICATKPTVLFCDLRLNPGESKTFWYKEILPVEGPPSFRGQILRYTYKLTIGTQRIHSPVRLLHVPIKVLVLQEFSDVATLNGNSSDPSDTGSELTQEDECLTDDDKESNSETAFQMLQIITSQRKQKFYNITNERGHVVKFCIFKQAYKLGEDIVGSLDFSESNVPCMQYAVSLQSIEELTGEHRSDKHRNHVSTYSKFHEMVIGFQQSHFVLPIPLHVTPSFHSDLIHLKWRLHFEFVISLSSINELGLIPNSNQEINSMDGTYWQAPLSTNIETMVWDLSLKLYPNLPSYLSQGLQMTTQYTQRI